MSMRWYQKPLYILIVLTSSIFVAEAAIMYLLFRLPPFTPWVEGLIDALLLTILVFPVLYLFLFRPLLLHIAERERAEEALRKAQNKLEIQVQERTADLAKTNGALPEEITERKWVEEVLQAAKDYAENLVDSSIDMIISVDVNRIIMEFNRAAEQTFGYSRAEVLGKPVDLLYADPSEGLQVHTNALKEGRFTGEITNKRKNGETFYSYLSASMMRDTNGRIMGVMGISRDITEERRRRQEQEVLYQLAHDLARSRDISAVAEHLFARARSLLGAEYEGLLLANSEGSELRGVTARGMDPEVFRQERIEVGKELALAALVFQKRRPVVVADWAHSPLVSERLREKYHFVESAWGVPLMSGEGAVGVFTVGYTTRREATPKELRLLQLLGNEAALAIERARLTEELEQRVEERTRELREAQEKLVRKEKLATLGQLASSVSHELRQPLSVMTNALYYLHTKMEPQETDPDIKEYLGILQTEVNIAEKIVRDLLDFARIRPPQRQAAAVGEVVMDQMARLSVPSTVRVQQEFPAELPLVYVDRVQIGQVISNLLRNALEAMEKQGGTLTLTGAQAGDGQVMLSVTDTGEGIAAEKLEKIFEPLYTTKARGIGLGLSISQGLAQANGGDLQVQSWVGEGSTFTLVLPAPPSNYLSNSPLVNLLSSSK